MVVASICLIGAVIVLIYNNVEEQRVDNEVNSIVLNLEKQMEQYEKVIDDKSQKDLTWLDDNETVGTYYSKKINNVNYIGLLYFPGIDNLSVPVVDECNDDNLKIASCRYAGSIKSGNIVIAGHNYRSIFGKLASKMQINDTVYFKDLEGIMYKYKLVSIENLQVDEVARMQEGNWDLTLFTCAYDGQERVTFRFELSS